MMVIIIMCFQKCLKRAGEQCRAWGKKTLSELSPAELCHIHKEVSSIIMMQYHMYYCG